MSVCYDLRFPELYRRLGADGARILVVPAAFTATTGPGPLGDAPAGAGHREPGVRDRRGAGRPPRRRHGLARPQHDRGPVGGGAGRRRRTARASPSRPGLRAPGGHPARACPPCATAGTSTGTARPAHPGPGRRTEAPGSAKATRPSIRVSRGTRSASSTTRSAGPPIASAGGRPSSRRGASTAAARAAARRMPAPASVAGPRSRPSALPASRPPAVARSPSEVIVSAAEPVDAGRRPGGGDRVAHQHQPPPGGPGDAPPRPPARRGRRRRSGDDPGARVGEEGRERRRGRARRCRASR